MKKNLLTCLVSLGLISYANAQQVGIGTNTPDASAKLDIASGGNTGILFPRVALTATNVAGPVTSPANWLTVFNTATAGSGSTAVLPGLYYWNTATSEWIRLRTSADGGTLDAAYDYNGPGAGRIINATDGPVLIQGTDGFQVVGDFGNGAPLTLSGGGTRAFFYPRKSAFRAGSVANAEWNDANIGSYSVAMGLNTTASYIGSMAVGYGTNANGAYAHAMGYQTTAGEYSTSMGYQTTAGTYSTAMGAGTNASGTQSTAIGSYTTASGFGSTAMGNSTTASAFLATAMGYGTTASGEWTTAMGYYNTSSGKGSTTMGISQTAFSYGETVLGIGATNYTPNPSGITEFRVANGTDRLFVIGNAIDANNNDIVDASERSNALTILKNGTTTLSTLAGTGTRLVTATSTGTLGTGTSTSLINAHNGLSEVGTDEVILGGALDQATTTITQDGTESFTIANAGSGGTYINLASTGDFQVQDNGVTQFHVEDNGNVGIGITGATGTQAKFDLRSNAIIGDFNATGFYNSNAMVHIRKTDAPHLLMEDIANNTGGLALDGNGIYMATESTRNIYFKTGVTNTGSFISTGTTQLFINGSNGRVGIGTTTPAYTLTVPTASTFGYGNGTATYSSRTETRANAGLQGNAGAQSGFFETDVPAPAANWYPGASSWQHLIDVRHSNDGNNYAMQLAGSFFDQNLWFRKTNNNAATAWSRILTTLDNGNFIQNQNAAAQATSNYWISGNGRMNGSLTVGTSIIIDNNGANAGNISASALVFGGASGEAIASKRNAGGNQFGLDFYTNNINRMAITQAGNVGVGTTTPGATLNVIHPTFNTTPTKPTGNWAAIIENNQDASDSRNGLAVATRWGSDASTIFEAGSYWTGGAQAYTPILSVKGSLNVGVGITSPPNKFTVNNANTTPATVGSYPFAVARGSSVEYTVGSDGNYVYNQSWNSKALLINAMGNNVGIGMSTLPTQKLDVQGGNARINNVFIGDVGHGATWAGLANSSQANTTAYGLLMSSDGNYTLINKQNTGGGYIGFRVANADQVVILNNGNMGIGTTGPGYKLSVNGTIEAGDAFAAGGQNLRIGDDTYFSDVDLASTLGLYSTSQTFANMSIGNVANDPGMVSGGTASYVHRDGTQIFGDGGRYAMVASLSVNGNTSDETGGFYADGNAAAIWSPGDANQGQPAALLYFMDDDFYNSSNTNPYDNTALKSYINASGALVTVSDERKKNTIKPISNALSRLQNVGGYEYYFNLAPEEVKKGDVAKLQSGVLAQEIAKQFPTVVEQSQQGDMFVNYSAITPYLIEAIKEQQAQLKAQQEEIKALRALVEQK